MRKTLVSSAAAATLLCVVAGSLWLLPEQDSDVDVSANDINLQAVFTESEATLKQAAEAAEKQVTLVRKGEMSDVFIDSEFTSLQNTIVDLKNYTPLQQFTEYSQPNTTPTDGTEQEVLLKEISIITLDAVEALNLRVQNWTSTVDRMREETAPEQETSDERILRLQSEMNLPFPYRIGECALNELNHETAWGCYSAGDDFYTVTLSGLAASDCNLRTTLAHEHHHYLQWLDGYFEGPESKSTAWLEADARENEWKGGGC